MTWVVLAFWFAVLPLWPAATAKLWFVHLAVVLLLGMLLLPRLLRAPSVRVGLPAIAVALALLSLALSIVLARPEASRSELCAAGLTGLAHALFFLLCLQWFPDADADPARVKRVRLGLAALLVALVAGQFLLVLVEGQIGDPEHRPDGSLGNPNVLGTVVGATALALVGLLRLRRFGLVLLLLAFLPYLVLTRSRGALLATGVALLLLAIHWRVRALLAGVAVGAVLLLVVPNPLRDRVLSLHADHDFSRPFLWASAASRIAGAPLGIGPAMNRYDFPRVAWDAAHPWLLHQRHSIGLTHNVFLTLTLEWGWLAGAALLVLAAFVTWRLCARRLLGDDPLCLGATLGATVLFLELQVDGIEQNPLAFSLFLLLLAAALARASPAAARAAAAVEGGPESAAPAVRGLRVPGRVAVLPLLLALALLGTGLSWRVRDALLLGEANELVAAHEAARGQQGAATAAAPALDRVRAALSAAECVVPHDPDAARARFLFERGVVRALLDDSDARACPAGKEAADDPHRKEIEEASAAAFAALDRACAANGLESELPYLGAQFALLRYRHLGHLPVDFAAYVRLMQRVLELDPLDVESRWELAQEAQRAGQTHLMEAQLAEVFRLEPDYAYAWYVLARLADASGAKQRSLYCYLRASEAQLNCQLKAAVPNPASRAFFEGNVAKVDLVEVWARIVELRRELYF